MTDREQLCAAIGQRLADRGLQIAVAESLTGGMVSQCFAAAPGSSDWYLGGVVAYHRSVKYDMLSVPEGPVVTEEAAAAMATGVQKLTGADVVAAVTGAGGPDGQDGQPPGTVWIAVITPTATLTRRLRCEGDPPEVCELATQATVELVATALDRET